MEKDQSLRLEFRWLLVIYTWFDLENQPVFGVLNTSTHLAQNIQSSYLHFMNWLNYSSIGGSLF